MFNKYSPGIKSEIPSKTSNSLNREKEKEMLDKLSRIEESYVDAAIRSVKRFTGKKKFGFES